MKAEQRQKETQHKDSITNEDENDETFPMKEFEPDQKSNDSSSRASTPTLKIRSSGGKKDRPNTDEFMGMLCDAETRTNKAAGAESDGEACEV